MPDVARCKNSRNHTLKKKRIAILFPSLHGVSFLGKEWPSEQEAAFIHGQNTLQPSSTGHCPDKDEESYRRHCTPMTGGAMQDCNRFQVPVSMRRNNLRL